EGRKNTQSALVRVSEEEDKKTRALAALEIEQQKTLKANALLREQMDATELERSRAMAARNVARDRYESAVQAYNVFVSVMDRKMTNRPGLQDLRETLLTDSTEGLKKLISSGGADSGAADRTLVAAYRQMGEVYQLLGNTAKARDNFKEAVKTAA